MANDLYDLPDMPELGLAFFETHGRSNNRPFTAVTYVRRASERESHPIKSYPLILSFVDERGNLQGDAYTQRELTDEEIEMLKMLVEARYANR